jgi:hypothetical protein
MIAGAAAALAASQSRESTIVAGSSIGSATATCKHGRSALAGGFATPFDPSTSAGPVVRFASMPSGRRGMRAKAFNFKSEEGELDSFAYCGAHAPRIAFKRIQLFPNGYGTAVALCKRGSQAIGGGFGTNKFSASRGPRIIAFTSRRAGKRGWRVSGFTIGDQSGDAAGRLIAYAYCKATKARVVTRSKTVEASSNELETLDVKCPKHRKALSGGFDGHFGSAPSGLRATVAITSKRVAHGRAWRTDALDASQDPAPITGYVYCRR